MKKRKTTTGPKPPVKDFAKVKKKVGKTARLPSNATQTKFTFSQIHVPTQNLPSADSSPSTLTTQLNHHLSRLSHYSGAHRKEGLIHLSSLLLSSPSLLSLELSSILSRTAECIVDQEKPVRVACISLYSSLFPLLPSLPPAFLRLLLTHCCSGLCHLEPSIRRTSLDLLSLLMQHYPLSIGAYEAQLLPAFLSLLSASSLSSSSFTAQPTSSAFSDKAQVSAKEVAKAAVLHRLQMLNALDKLLKLCPQVRIGQREEEEKVEGSESGFSLNALLRRRGDADNIDDNDEYLHTVVYGTAASCPPPSDPSSSPSSLPSLAVSAVPLKYQRKGGSHGKKSAIITTTDDSRFLSSLSSPSSSSSPSSPSPPFSSLSLLSFLPLALPSLINHWLESLAGDQQQSTVSSLTAESLQCAAACASILRTLALASPTSLSPFLPSLSSHVLSAFPVGGEEEGVSEINVSLCFVIAAAIEGAEEVKEVDEERSDVKRGEGKRKKEEEKAVMIEEWTSALLDFIGRAFYPSSSSSSSAFSSLPKQRKGATTSLQSSHVTQLLPIVRSLLPRLSEERQVWLVEAFTSYFLSLHPLSPAKARCLPLLFSLLSPPSPYISLPIAHSWMASLPPYLLSSPPPATSASLLSLLRLLFRCYPSIAPQLLPPLLFPFFSSSLFSLPPFLQFNALSLLYSFPSLPLSLLSDWVGKVGKAEEQIREMMLEVVTFHRHSIGLAPFLSFLLSSVSSRHSPPPSLLPSVLQRFRQACDDIWDDQVEGSEVVVIVLEPTLRRAMDGEGELKLSDSTMLSILQCLYEEVQRRGSEEEEMLPLPPSLLSRASRLLLSWLHSAFTRQSLWKEAVPTGLSFLAHCPLLLRQTMEGLGRGVREEEGRGEGMGYAHFACELLTSMMASRELRGEMEKREMEGDVLDIVRLLMKDGGGRAALTGLRSLAHTLYGGRAERELKVLEG